MHDHTIDGQAVPRRPRLRTRRDLALLVWRSVVLGAFVVWAWNRWQDRTGLVAIATLGEVAVVAAYTRLRAAPHCVGRTRAAPSGAKVPARITPAPTDS